ncbi:putative arginine N-methyltransferase [Neospora caninum Liverpool]|uniref:Arginine N-methyltransferase, putative n=1 Tax=Neospora caninum (strain Liverpool) TaxID=572307 RepID=F0V742_NEOCL|nr:putative arginine N-methyltransferase [Neospora caninum Liverpool]CBZ49533.1 putative arginine N-methyltransferase [Neospora caninum Liverpool]CEL64112.1 TPA: arginine N-methyltransferase, putative [Neospora caninum Liverpool]|eukprot:XP_003879568.1 putative arginine N-methyltransferase [Neospora caninum Liverpool]
MEESRSLGDESNCGSSPSFSATPSHPSCPSSSATSVSQSERDESAREPATSSLSEASGGASSSNPSPSLSSSTQSPSPVSASSSSASCAYYSSYGDPSVHSYMLRDGPRTSAYHRAIAENRRVLRNAVVMDVGAGSGILSLFAARDGGAKRVYALEPSDAFWLLQEIVEVNNLQSVVLPVHATVEELIDAARMFRALKQLHADARGPRPAASDREKAKTGAKHATSREEGQVQDAKKEPNEEALSDLEALMARDGVRAFLEEMEASGLCENGKDSACRFVDAIVSEWMGFYLLHEGMLDSVLKARDVFLRPGGRLFPSRARLRLALADCSEYWASRLQCFTDFHGFNFTPLQQRLLAQMQAGKQPLLVQLKPSQCAASAPALLFDWDLAELPVAALQAMVLDARLTATRQTPVHAFAIWFECLFPQCEAGGETLGGRGEAAAEESEADGQEARTNGSATSGEARPECAECSTVLRKCRQAFSVEAERRREAGGAEATEGEKTRVGAKAVERTAENRREENGAGKGEGNREEACAVRRDEGVLLDTGPFSDETHWKQTVVLLPQAMELTPGLSLTCQVHLRKAHARARAYEVEIEVVDAEMEEGEQEEGEADAPGGQK